MILLLTTALLFAQEGQKSELKNVMVLPYTKKADIIKYMKKTVSPELNVKCNFCHDMRDYSSDENEHKIIAREMMQMVMDINKKTLQPLKLDTITCWVCHRGNTDPELTK